MAIHNNPEGFRGIPPSGHNFLGNCEGLPPPKLHDGLYYRSDLPVNIEPLESRLVDMNAGSKVQDYQIWTETAWTVEHGTIGAVERFNGKLLEELIELNEAIVDYTNDPSHADELKNAVVSEAGDVLWCATALACLANADIDSGIKNRLFRYIMGVQHFEKGNPVKPSWRDTASTLAVKYGQLEVKEIDSLIIQGFEPLPSPVMNVFDVDHDDENIEDHMNTLLFKCHQFMNGAERQFGGPKDEQSAVLPSAFEEQARQASEVVAEIYLELGYITAKVVGVSLSEIIQLNVHKISSRIESNTVVKEKSTRGIDTVR
jgi:hypothetical protein